VWLKNQGVRIVTDGDAADSPFIAGLTVDGDTHASSWLPLRDIKNGADLDYALATRPTTWAAAEAQTPPSGADADYTRATAAAAKGH
jgi:putative alpha-1,2-mannosidase